MNVKDTFLIDIFSQIWKFTESVRDDYVFLESNIYN